MIKTSVTGEARIYAHKRTGASGDYYVYSASIGKKRQNSDEWDNAWINVRFKKDEAPQDREDIQIKNGWLSFDHYEKDGKDHTAWYIFVLDWERAGEKPERKSDAEPRKDFHELEDYVPF